MLTVSETLQQKISDIRAKAASDISELEAELAKNTSVLCADWQHVKDFFEGIWQKIK
jgi:predicted ATPase